MPFSTDSVRGKQKKKTWRRLLDLQFSSVWFQLNHLIKTLLAFKLIVLLSVVKVWNCCTSQRWCGSTSPFSPAVTTTTPWRQLQEHCRTSLQDNGLWVTLKITFLHTATGVSIESVNESFDFGDEKLALTLTQAQKFLFYMSCGSSSSLLPCLKHFQPLKPPRRREGSCRVVL